MSCLDDATLDALARGRLPREEAMRAHAHVVSCDACAARLEKIETGSAVEKLGRYVLVGEVGRGGMGRVFRAVDPRLERTVAVKVLRSERQSPQDRERLLHEAQTLAKLSHPHLVTVFDAGEDKGNVFLAMEYLEGETLAEWLATKRPLEDVLRVFRQAGEGLAAAHEAGVVHRDFKPSNVLLHKGAAKVTDLGLARAATTETVEVAGTRGYMAPEQREGRFDARSDQYAFGVALAEALEKTGQPTPRWLQALTQRARAEKPDERFPSMRALLDALAADPVRRRRRVLAGALVALFIVSVGAALGVAQQRRLASCDGGEARVDEVFGPGVRAAVERQLAAIFPEAAARAHAQALSSWADGWRTLHRDVCVATRVRGVQSDELFTLKTLCLERQMAHFSAVVEKLAAGAVEAEALASALADLPRTAGCQDGDALVFHNASETAAERRAAQPVREQLDRAVALSSIGKDDEAAAVVSEGLAKARASGMAPLLSEALVLEGQLSVRRGDGPKAREHFTEAYRLASASRHDAVASRAATELMVTYSATPDAMAAVRTFAEAALERAGRDDDNEGTFHFYVGLALFEQGHYEQAEQAFSRALKLRVARYGERAPMTRSARVNLAMTYERQHRTDEALALYEEALRADEAEFGPTSATAVRSRVTWAAGLVAAHRYDAALAVLEQARKELERFGVVENDARFTVLDNLGAVLEAKRRWKEAMVFRDEQLQVAAEDEFLLAITRTSSCRTRLELGDREGAQRDAESARAYLAASNADHPGQVTPLTVLGRLERDDAKARALLERAVELGKDADLELLADAEWALAERVKEPERSTLFGQAGRRYEALGLRPPRPRP